MFVFCEACFRLPEAVGALQISTCQHMICRRCKKSTTNCSVCQKACRFAELSEGTIPEKLVPYFDQDPGSRVELAYKVEQFQSAKMDVFLAGQIHVLEQYEQKKKTARKLQEHDEALKKAMLEEETLIRKLEAQRKASRSHSLSVFSGSGSLNVSDPFGKTFEHGQKRGRHTASGGSSGNSSNSLHATGSKRLTPESAGMAFKVPTFSPSYDLTPSPGLPPRQLHQQQSHRQHFASGGGNQRSTSVQSLPANIGQRDLRLGIARKPADLMAATREGIVQETVRNINRATNRPPEAIHRVTNRGNDIERARNVYF